MRKANSEGKVHRPHRTSDTMQKSMSTLVSDEPKMSTRAQRESIYQEESLSNLLDFMSEFGYNPRGSRRLMDFIQHEYCRTLISRVQQYATTFLKWMQLCPDQKAPGSLSPRLVEEEAPATEQEIALIQKQLDGALRAVGNCYMDVLLDFGDFAQHADDKIFFELLITFVCFKIEKSTSPTVPEWVNLQLELGNLFRSRGFNRTGLNAARRLHSNLLIPRHQLRRDEIVGGEKPVGYENRILHQLQPPTHPRKVPHRRIRSLKKCCEGRSPLVGCIFPTIAHKMSVLRDDCQALRGNGSQTNRSSKPKKVLSLQKNTSHSSGALTARLPMKPKSEQRSSGSFKSKSRNHHLSRAGSADANGFDGWTSEGLESVEVIDVVAGDNIRGSQTDLDSVVGSSDLNSLGFHITSYTPEDVSINLAITMFKTLDVLECHQIQEAALARFLQSLRQQEAPVYYNWATAINQLQMVYYMLHICKCSELFPKISQLALLVAAVTVNWKHPGCGILMFVRGGLASAVEFKLRKVFQVEMRKAVSKLMGQTGVLSMMPARLQHLLEEKLRLCYAGFYETEARLLQERHDNTLQDLIKRSVQGGHHRLVLENPQFLPFFFDCAIRSQIGGRPLVPAMKHFENLLAECESLGCEDRLVFEDYCARKVRVKSGHQMERMVSSLTPASPAHPSPEKKIPESFEAKNTKRELYQGFKLYIEETMEMPLLALTTVCGDLQDILNNIGHFRSELSSRVQAMQVMTRSNWEEPLPGELERRRRFEQYECQDKKSSWRMRSSWDTESVTADVEVEVDSHPLPPGDATGAP